MGRFLIYLSGGRPDVLDRIPRSRSAFLTRGAALLISAVLLAAGAAQSLDAALRVDSLLAGLLGCVIGAVYLIFARVPVIPGASLGRRAALLIPHFLLAILLGSVVAQVQALTIFRPDIDAQIAVMQAHAESTFLAAQSASSLGKRATTLQAEVDALQKIINSGGQATLSPQYDPVLAELKNQLTNAQAQELKDYSSWQCQLYGEYNGTRCPQGNGPAAVAAEDAYNADKSKVANLQGQIAARETLLTSTDASAARTRVSTAREQLPGVTAELNSTENELSQQISDFTAVNHADNGLLAQFTALNDLGNQNATIRAATLVLTLFFLLIAALPGFVSLIQPVSDYEKLLEAVNRQETLQARRLLHAQREDTLLASVLEREATRASAQRPPAAPASDEAADLALRDMPDMRRAGSPDAAQVSGDPLSGPV